MATHNPVKPPDQSAAALPDGVVTLLYQLLETEMGGVQIYRTAIQCAIHPDLRAEWTKYLAETERHVVVARAVLIEAGLDPDAETPARLVCRHKAEGLVHAMLEALGGPNPAEAQITAAEAVVNAETKDHMNWELVGTLARKMTGRLAETLRAAYDEVEVEEDHHLYHTTGWARELWIESLGLPAALPPPEEKLNVESAIGAAKAKKARDQQV
jgi:hypothetical protein